jgi:hypothetical protein
MCPSNFFAPGGIPGDEWPAIITLCNTLSRIHAVGQKNFNAKALRRKEEFALGGPTHKMVSVGYGAKFASCPCDSASLRLCVFALNPFCMVPAKAVPSLIMAWRRFHRVGSTR